MMVYLAIFILVVVLEVLFCRFARKVDGVTVGGGFIFPVAMVAWYFLSELPYSIFIIGLVGISAISMVDDFCPQSILRRLAVQLAAVVALLFQWYLNDVASWIVIAAVIVICLGIINAYNFMDGINGMTGGYSLVVLASLWLINRSVAFIDELFLVVAMIAVGVFCIFNFRNKARCFAGDVGAVSIGYIILFALGMLILNTGNMWYIMLLAVYGVDSVLTIIRRCLLRENIFATHRKHCYQVLVYERGYSHLAVVCGYMCVQLVISFGVIYLPVGWIYSVAAIVGLVLAYFGFVYGLRR